MHSGIRLLQVERELALQTDIAKVEREIEEQRLLMEIEAVQRELNGTAASTASTTTRNKGGRPRKVKSEMSEEEQLLANIESVQAELLALESATATATTPAGAAGASSRKRRKAGGDEPALSEADQVGPQDLVHVV
jgi:hypothetical protein